LANITLSSPETPYPWPGHSSADQQWSGEPAQTRLGALKAALQRETRGYASYCTVVATSQSSEVVALAMQFIEEQADHVKILEASVAHEECAAPSAQAI
jgi:hypothetical protein